MGTKARILVSFRLEGKDYKPNQLVDFPPETADALKKQGQIDTSAAAVRYCTDTLKATLITHASPEGKKDDGKKEGGAKP
jgi:hypothetical protein